MSQSVVLSGREKAAILLVSVGTANAVKIFKYLKDEEIEQLTTEIAKLGKVEVEMRKAIIEDFSKACRVKSFYNDGSINYVKEVLEMAIGPQKAAQLVERLMQSTQDRPFDFIKKVDPNQLLNIIQNEHAQTIALIFSYLSPQQAAAVLAALPREKQAEVATRIAMMDMTSPEFTSEIERILRKKLTSLGKESYTASGGIQAIVDILNAADRGTEKAIFETLEVTDSELAEAIKKRMFVFEDIINLDNKAVQLFLKEVDVHELALALKSATDEVKQRIVENMSKRMYSILEEEIELLGPVKLRDVEEAQQRIVSIIRKLEDAGEIIVSKSGGDEIIV
ncbi:MAG: flagellar motor switch protein FliG [Eubacteriales bacterium]|jgi:flagellar motor switch protein FliG|nr:flagellar motor switch protein FliG [Eubacteriales bacterium]